MGLSIPESFRVYLPVLLRGLLLLQEERRGIMSTIFSERHGVDTDEPEWVDNLRAEYERRIADLQKENDRMILEENQEIAQLQNQILAWRRKVNAQEESIDHLRTVCRGLQEQVNAYRQVPSEKEEHR